MKLFKELSDFYNFFWKTPEEEKKIVIYAEHKDYYTYFEGLIDELLNRNNETICYITSDPNDPVFQKLTLKFKTFYIDKLLAFFMLFVRCKVFIMTLTDLNRFHLKRSINHNVHYIYIFHAMVSTHMVYLEGAFDYYDSILCVSPYQIDEIKKREKLNGLPEKKLIKAGYYRLERIYTEYQKFLMKKPAGSPKTTVLIAPSWGDKNILESFGEELVELLLKNEYEVIVRPHPETVKRSYRQLVNLVKRFGNNTSFTLEWSVATDNSLLKADVLICDCSGVAIEYAFGTERPVLFIDVPYKIRNTNYKELGIEPFELSIRTKIGTVLPQEELNKIPEVIGRLKSDQEKYKKCISTLRQQNVYAFLHSAEIGAKYISDILLS